MVKKKLQKRFKMSDMGPASLVFGDGDQEGLRARYTHHLPGSIQQVNPREVRNVGRQADQHAWLRSGTLQGITQYPQYVHRVIGEVLVLGLLVVYKNPYSS